MIFKVTNEIDQARQQMNLEKGDLEDWLKIQSEKEEDTLALMKYSKEDDNKIKDISIQIEKLLQEVYNKKNLLSSEVTETQVAQIELDRCTEIFRQLHSERQDLIKKWEDAVHTMQQRDNDIEQAQKRHQNLSAEAQSKLAIVNEKQKFLDERIEKNHELEKKIEHSDRMVGKYRMEQQGSEASLRTFQDELDFIRNSLSSLGLELNNRKSEIGQMRIELQEKQKKCSKAEHAKTSLKEKLNHVMDKSVSLDEKSKEVSESGLATKFPY
jgi:chromosome segregation ATPase